MDYQDMSDYEVNLRLLKILLRGQPGTVFHDQESDEMLEIMGLDGSFDHVRITTQMGNTQTFNFCGRWGQAGGIAERYRIGIEPSNTDNGFCAYSNEAGTQYSSKKPTRAIAICALMMLEGES